MAYGNSLRVPGIPQYDRQTVPGVQSALPGPRASADAFGAPVAKGLAHLGAGLENLGKDIERHEDEKFDLELIRRKEQYMNNFRQFNLNMAESGQGAAGVNASQAYQKIADEDWSRQFLDGLEGSERQMLRAQQTLSGLNTHAYDYGARWEIAQVGVAKQDTMNRREAELEEQWARVDLSDQEKLALLGDYIANELPALASGRDVDDIKQALETKLRTAMNSANVARIETLTQAGDFAAARAMNKASFGESGRMGLTHMRESGGGNPKAVNENDGGKGPSFGSVQVTTANMDGPQGYIAYFKQNTTDEAALSLMDDFAKADSQGRIKIWREKGDVLDGLAEKFTEERNYKPLVSQLNSELQAAMGSNPVVDQIIMSTANQHGPGSHVARELNNAWAASGGDLNKFASAVYDWRVSNFPSLAPGERESVIKSLRAEQRRVNTDLGFGISAAHATLYNQNQRKIEAAEADNTAMSFVGRLENGEDESVLRREILNLPKAERNAVLRLFNSYKTIIKEEQREAIQDGIINNRARMEDMGPGEAYKFVEGLPETTPMERKIKEQAQRDYGLIAAHAGLSKTTDPDAYNRLVDAITYGEVTGEKALRSHEDAAKVAKTDLNKLVNDLKGASIIKETEIRTAYRWAIGKDEDSPNAKPLTNKEKADLMKFSAWANQQAQESNKAKEPGYVRELARQWRMQGETPARWGIGYGRDATLGESANDSNWLPDLDKENKERIENLLKSDPEAERAWVARYGGDKSLAMRAYYNYELKLSRGPRQREVE